MEGEKREKKTRHPHTKKYIENENIQTLQMEITLQMAARTCPEGQIGCRFFFFSVVVCLFVFLFGSFFFFFFLFLF